MTDKKKKFQVVVPPRNPYHMKEWLDVTDFPTPEEALKYVQKTYGADHEGRVSLIKETDAK